MVTDIHSHILPAIDDGSSSLAESLELLEMEARQGVTHVVATPHFYARYDRPEAFFAKRKAAEERLREQMERYPHLPKLSIGAEVLFFRGMSQSDVISGLTIGEKRCILLEMEEAPWQEYVFREVEGLIRDRGLTPIIAHVERYMFPFHSNKHIARLMEMPVLIQCNAGFFLDRRTRHKAMTMLSRHQIHLLGSDCHSVAHRPPRLGEAVDRINKELGPAAVEWICSNEKAVFADQM